MKFSNVFIVFLTALVVGGGVYLWQNKDATEIVTSVNEDVAIVDVEDENDISVFQDSWLTFEYPQEVEILADGQGEGRATRWLTFMYWDEEKMTYSPVGLVLQYPTPFKEGDFYSFRDAYKKTYDEKIVQFEEMKSAWYYKELTVDGRDAFLISETGMGDPVITFYITFDMDSEKYTTSDAYRFSTAGMTGYSKEIAKKVMDQFISTAKFYQ